MLQGAGSNVGKSILVAGLCRHLTRLGFEVRPFKPQNMSNNAAVTVDGGEIGRAQALQAIACQVEPHTDMNPVLLKPESERGAQVIVQGKRYKTLQARDYAKEKPNLLAKTIESFQRLSGDADFVIIEGAGSPAEINLRAGDIANMGFAEAVDAPVCLIGDIDRGGVIAQLVGTDAILPANDRDRITSFIVNKFRGDPSLFDDGLSEIIERTGWKSIGVLPWFEDAWKLPAEDIMDVASSRGGRVKIAVPKLARIANFDDLDPLTNEPEVEVDIVEAGRPLPGDADLVLIPGSKSTIGDLAFFRDQGWDIDLQAHLRRGGQVLGICGGYQMLGQTIHDPEGIEGSPSEVKGLGHLDVDTVMTPKKNLNRIKGRTRDGGHSYNGYEIHIGETDGPDTDAFWLFIGDDPHGATSCNGQIKGCYLHGIFDDPAFRSWFIEGLGARSNKLQQSEIVDKTLNALADHMEKVLDLDALVDTAREPKFGR